MRKNTHDTYALYLNTGWSFKALKDFTFLTCADNWARNSVANLFWICSEWCSKIEMAGSRLGVKKKKKTGSQGYETSPEFSQGQNIPVKLWEPKCLPFRDLYKFIIRYITIRMILTYVSTTMKYTSQYILL